jgi:hypothetical protein
LRAPSGDPDIQATHIVEPSEPFMLDTPTALPLAAGTASVAENYRHIRKRITPRDGLALPNAWIKWYDLAADATPVEDDVRMLARDFLTREAVARRFDVRGEIGFAILHRCGVDFYFLLVSTWRNENELWESIYAKATAATPDFSPFAFEGQHRGAFCVWELGAVWHEQQAWSRYLVSRRDAAARAAYVEDQYEGLV